MSWGNDMKQTLLNLDNLLDGPSYDHAVICTFTFDPDFFEEYCLEKFNSLKTNGNITVIVDYGTYLQAITGSKENKPKQANIRYLLHPISLPGKFHTKLFLLVSKNKGRLIVGSANFTKPGITTNAEMVNYYDFEIDKHEEFRYLFQAAFVYLSEISCKWPSNALTSNLKSMEREATWLVSEKIAGETQDVNFLHNLEIPLWDQLLSYVTPPVDLVHVLSRFFDSKPYMLDRVLKDLKPHKIKIYTQNGITTLTESWLDHPLFKDGTLEIYCCNYMDGDYLQPLHAKSIAISKDNTCLLAFGSANFTSPALMRVAESGNAELLLLHSRLPSAEIQLESLFNPLENGYRLLDDGTLQTAPRQSIEGCTFSNKTILHCAEFVENVIRFRASIHCDLEFDEMAGKIQFQDEAYKMVSIHHNHDDEYYTESLETVAGRLSDASSIMTIQTLLNHKIVDESNPVLVVNLIDIKSGKHVRRERFIKEAQQGSIEFFRILENLIKEGDEEPLITFFNFCDIPITDATRSYYPKGGRSVWDGGKGMKCFGEKNLKIFNNLHDSAMSFYMRHFKKLQRHVRNGSINGVINYLHIFLAMGGVLQSQVERLMLGFEAKSTPLDIDTWYQYRKIIDTYFLKFKELMSCLNDNYMPKLFLSYDRSTIIEKFDPDLQPIKDLCTDMLAFQSRMDLILNSNLRIKSQTRKVFLPSYSQYNVFFPDNWVKYEVEQDDKMRSVLLRLTA
jgi:HKD family nuclease